MLPDLFSILKSKTNGYFSLFHGLNVFLIHILRENKKEKNLSQSFVGGEFRLPLLLLLSIFILMYYIAMASQKIMQSEESIQFVSRGLK